jgi:hypothetical protein
MKPQPRSRWNAPQAKSAIERRHSSKLGIPFSSSSKVKWLTRKTGTDEQRGKHFPILGSRASLPKLRFKAASKALSPLEKQTLREEDDMKAAFGKRAWACGVTYKDGTIDMFPVVASSYAEAMKKIGPKIERPEDVTEIVLCNPLGETLHKIGRAAVAAARKIAGAAKKVYKKGEAEALKAARRVGRVAALPEKIREAYEVGIEARPGIIPAEAGQPARRVLTPEEASMLVAEVMRGTPMTEQERRMIEAAPMLYRPREEPPPYTVEELRAAQKRIAERRAAAPKRRADHRISPVAESYFTKRHRRRD